MAKEQLEEFKRFVQRRQDLKDGKCKAEKYFDCIGCKQRVFNFIQPCNHLNTFCIDCHLNRLVDHKNSKYYDEKDAENQFELDLIKKLNQVENVITNDRSLKCGMCFAKIENVLLVDFNQEWKFCQSGPQEGLENLDLVDRLVSKIDVAPLREKTGQLGHGVQGMGNVKKERKAKIVG